MGGAAEIETSSFPIRAVRIAWDGTADTERESERERERERE